MIAELSFALEQAQLQIRKLETENSHIRLQLDESNSKLQEFATDYEYLREQFRQSEEALWKLKAELRSHKELPQRMAISLVRSVSNHIEKANKINFTVLHKYIHETFLHEEYAIEGNELLPFLDNLFSELDKIQKIKPTKQRSAEEIVKQDLTSLKEKAVIFATLLGHANPDFIWDYATMQAIIVRSLAGSRLIIDMISIITPGSCVGKTFERNLDLFVEKSRQSDGLYLGSNCCLVYDNAPAKEGYVCTPIR